MTAKARVWAAGALALPLVSIWAVPAAASDPGEGTGALMPWLSCAPFALLLLAIAVLPVAAPHWWHSNRNRALVSFGIAVPFAVTLLIFDRTEGLHHLTHSVLDYLSFIALIGALFIISGGIHLKGSLNGTPLANTGLLAVGAVLANLIGTTGASMILIRPFLRANEERKSRVHQVVFFIFVVSNCGGLLTPLGDPPLYLGFLKGVPFTWTSHLWLEWLAVNGLVLVLFNFYDEYQLDREEKRHAGSLLKEAMEHEPLRVVGGRNFLFLLGVVLVILGKGGGWFHGGEPWPFGVQELLLVGLTVASYLTTPRSTRELNRFTFAPIIEVAVLFAGIFITMTSPLLILNARGESLGVSSPMQYFWATGLLSSFLDNAPTYLAMASAAAGQFGVGVESARFLGELLAQSPEAQRILAAISCGAVFMGANTYIGNGPNFMVKAIAEENGVRMPSFFGYMAYSMAILLPAFALVSLIFFR